MPTVTENGKEPQRSKTVLHPFSNMAMVARAVGRKEMLANEAALTAVQKELLTLHEKVWDFRKARSRRDVLQEAHACGKTVIFGRIHALCHEKNEELPIGHPNRKF